MENAEIIVLPSNSKETDTTESENIEYNPDHFADIMKRMETSLKKDQLCDVVLIAGIDGRRISAHRLVLVASSDYFAAMFTGSLCESTEKEVTLEEVRGDILEILVHYCYTGCLKLQKSSVQILLGTANFLQFSSVVILCSNFIIQQLNSSNCLQFSIFAKAHNLDFLLKRTKTFINEHFMEVSESLEFLYLEIDEVSELITSDDINVLSEEFIFSAVKNWIDHEPETRNKHIPELLTHVRLPLLQPEYILENVEPHCDTKELQKLILDALKYNLVPHHKLVYADKVLIHRKPQRLLVAISKQDCQIEVYNKTKWSPLEIVLGKRNDFDVVVMNDQLFIMGGFEFSRGFQGSFNNSIENLSLTTMKSTEMHAMFATPLRQSSIPCNGSIYVLGGLTIDGSNSFQIWSPGNHKWASDVPPHFARKNVGICVLDEDLYVVGGKSHSGEYKSLVESYNIHEKVWEPRASMHLARSCLGLVVMNGCLYAIGGRGPEEGSIERFNPATNKWTLIPAPNLPSSEISCTALNNRIYVGAYNGLQEYDPARNVWRELHPPAAETYILVSVPNVIPVEFYPD